MNMAQSAQLLLLAAFWGASFLFMRVAVPEFGPIPLMEVRIGVGAICLMPLLFFNQGWQQLRAHWLAISLLGVLNTAVPFCLFAYGLVHLNAGFAAILNATAPMFGSLIAYLWLKERIQLAGLIGLLLGFFGVAVLSVGAEQNQQAFSMLAVVAILTATCLYGLAACIAKKYLHSVSAMPVAAGSQLIAALLLLPFGIVLWPASTPTINAWIFAIALGVICTAFAYILYFRLIAQVGASKAITVAYLVPVFGVLWGVIFLQEAVTATLMIGGSLVLLGVALTTGMIRTIR